MSPFTPAWIEHQRRRWTRCNAHLWQKPVTWSRTLMAIQQHPSANQVRNADRFAAEGVIELRSLLAAHLREPAELRRVQLAQKYSPDQPRIPAGNADGGQWTVEDVYPSTTAVDDQTPTDLSAASRFPGHHLIPQALIDKMKVPDEARKIFKETTTGRLLDERNNKFDREHRIYNEAVKKRYDQFVRENGIVEERMTVDQARAFVRIIDESIDPVIRIFNMRMMMREILRRLPVFVPREEE